jgi:YHS domain-containing protein
VRFCCDKCVEKFEKNPEKYLKEIDEMAAKLKKG